MVTELGGSQISTLLETLPGIANVLRSPVADALGSVIRAAARVGDGHRGEDAQVRRVRDAQPSDGVVLRALRRGAGLGMT